jgi:trigger factor
MTEPVITRLPKSLVEIKFVVSPEEAQPYLEQAAQDMQAAKPIAGFRPGKAPYDEVKKSFGEMRIWEAALERIVRARYVHTILAQSIESIGSPAIAVEQLVPGQDIKFTVTAPVMPNVISLMAYDTAVVTRKSKTIGAGEVDAAIEDLRKMRRTEQVMDRAATQEDMLLIDLEIKKDNVQLEGGVSKNYRIYLNEAHYIPGFADQLVGLKKGDVKTFTLPFPKDHYQKHLAGQNVDFTVTVHDAFELTLPTLDDEFAKTLGLESVAKLRELLTQNLTQEANHKADEAAEIELLEKLVTGSKFGEVPELLINEEVRRMFAELEHAAEEQGMDMGDYLAQLKKTADEIKMDMVPQAIRRVQTAVMIKHIAKNESIEIADEEVNAEIDRILEGAKDPEMRERVSSPDYRDYVAAQMKNRKALEILKQKAIKAE